MWTKELGGGALLDLGIYVVSFCHMVAGSPNEILASSNFIDQGVDSKTSMIFKYNDGLIANLLARCMIINPIEQSSPDQMDILKLTILFTHQQLLDCLKSNEEVVEYKNNYKGHGLREQAICMEECVLNNQIESDKMTHKDTLAVIKIMDEVRDKIGLFF